MKPKRRQRSLNSYAEWSALYTLPVKPLAPLEGEDGEKKFQGMYMHFLGRKTSLTLITSTQIMQVPTG
ncbi:unnamed protein product [Clavelina lepadiformis]|uniref:Uncharacterized protein n=1 Tax=Clavelina lepadiformis TaxID=159417 RepID=A0ABP0GZ25_CLALP